MMTHNREKTILCRPSGIANPGSFVGVSGAVLCSVEGGVVMNRRVLGVFAVVVFAVCVLCLTGCNTVHGVGTDIQNAADSTQQAIDKAFEGDK